MKANELSCRDLMVGDLVKIKTYGVSDKFERTEAYIYVKVAEICSSIITIEYNNDIKEPYRICESTEIEPIPLTPEILEKNGFVEKEFYSELIVGDFRILCDVHNVCVYHNEHVDLDIPIEYLHELQHALRLCGIEKEIVL